MQIRTSSVCAFARTEPLVQMRKSTLFHKLVSHERSIWHFERTFDDMISAESTAGDYFQSIYTCHPDEKNISLFNSRNFRTDYPNELQPERQNHVLVCQTICHTSCDDSGYWC